MAIKSFDIVLIPIEANDSSGHHLILVAIYSRQGIIMSMDSGDFSGTGLAAEFWRKV